MPFPGVRCGSSEQLAEPSDEGLVTDRRSVGPPSAASRRATARRSKGSRYRRVLYSGRLMRARPLAESTVKASLGNLCCMPNSLRCVDLASALQSVGALYGITKKALMAAVPKATDVALADPDDPVRAMVDAMAAVLGRSHTVPSSIHYFHGTRTSDPDRLRAEGLMPLHIVLPAIWEEVRAVVPEVGAKDIRRLEADMTAGRMGPHTYGLRASGSGHRGPCGHLVCDALLHPQAYSSVNYLAGSEIAVDICVGVGERFDIDVLERWDAATSACIVEFVGPVEDLEGALASALWYVESGIRADRTINANWSYDGDGEPVGPERIVEVTLTGERH